MKTIFLNFGPEYFKPVLYGLKKYEYRKRWCNEETEIMQTDEYKEMDMKRRGRESVTLFYATSNKSKLHNMYYRLRNYPIRVLCPDDLGIHIDVEESGKSVVENALMKAKAYYDAIHMPVIAGDSGVFIDGLTAKEQPGLYARRVHGTALSDDEMIEYYAKIAEKIGEPSYLHCVTGIVLITESGFKTMELKDAPLLLTAKPNSNRKHKGNPLDVVTMTKDGKYFNDLTDAERTALDVAGEQQFTNFIIENML